MYNKPNNLATKILSFVPGLSQYYQNEKFKGIIFFTLSASSLALANKYHQSFLKKNDEYINFQSSYEIAVSESTALSLGDQLNGKYQNAKSEAKLRDVFIYSTLGIYFLNIIEAINKPKSGFRNARNYDKKIIFAPLISKNNLSVKMSLNF